MNKKITSIPNATYREILTEAGRHISQRKGALALRVLAYSWPTLVLVGAFTYFSEKPELLESLINEQLNLFVAVVIPWIAFSMLNMAILSSLFENEKRIWIDSFFDKQNLTTAQSWRIAKRLFWPMFAFWLEVYIRVYLMPLVLLAVVMIGAPALGISLSDSQPNQSETIAIATGTAMILGVVGFAVYVFLTELRLRFLWFIFLDNYGKKDFNVTSSIAEQDRLNKVMKMDGFKRALVVDLGSDVIDIVVQAIVNEVVLGAASAVSKVNTVAGKITENVLGYYTKELTKQSVSLGRTAAFYILYREARQASEHASIHVNEHVYKLAQ